MALQASNMRQLSSLCQTVVTEVAQVYGQPEAEGADGRSSAAATFTASSDMWLRLSVSDGARMLQSLGHRVAAWLLRTGLEELVFTLCSGAMRVAWVSELQTLEERDGGLQQALASARADPPPAMLVSRLLVQLQNEVAGFEAAGGVLGGDEPDQADEELAESGSAGDVWMAESGPLPLREGEGSWAQRMQKEDIHVAMERYGLVR